MMGTLRLQITSADLSATLTALARLGIESMDVVQEGDLTVCLTIRLGDYRRLIRYLKKRGDTVKIVGRKGVYWRIMGLLHRPVLAAGMLFLLFLTLYLPTRVLFVRVEGNESVPTNLVLEQAQRCGICFWANRREVRSEKIKNALLGAIPELQWVGVNTEGCIATISVRERSLTQAEQAQRGVSSIVAARDGVVTEVTALKGNALCKVGQAVKAGEVLISGYTDLGLTIQATRAEGEVFAETKRYAAAVTPNTWTKKGEILRTEKKYALHIGKKQINFYKDSGISPATCDKMYSEYYVLLPGGFQLPVALIVEAYIYYDCTVQPVPEDMLEATLADFTRNYLADQMIAGQILEERMTTEQLQQRTCLYAEFSCLEMIGRVQSEEIIKSYGKTD